MSEGALAPPEYGNELLERRPKVSVIVPCRNERDHIEQSLLSVLSQEPVSGGFECIVADGMSTDGTRQILAHLCRTEPRLLVVDNPGQIVSSGLNAAVRAARGQVIVRMDAHTDYSPDYVRLCVETLERTGADNVGGPWIAVGTGRVSRAIAAAFHSRFAVGGARSHDPEYEGPVDTVYLGCWHRKALEDAGLFDEELVRNQDDELNLRLTRAGRRIWQSPRIRSRYHPRDSLRALFRQYEQYGYWKVRVIQKHRLPASLRHLVPGAFVLALLVLPVVGLVVRPALWVWAALVGVYGGAVLSAAILTAARKGWDLLGVLPAVFACYHLAYGTGFVRGVVDFVLLSRAAPRRYTSLTRGRREEAP